MERGYSNEKRWISIYCEKIFDVYGIFSNFPNVYLSKYMLMWFENAPLILSAFWWNFSVANVIELATEDFSLSCQSFKAKLAENVSKTVYHSTTTLPTTPETRFSEPRFSEVLNLMNELQLPFSYFALYPDLILVNKLNLVNKRGLTTMFIKSNLGCTI